MELRFKFFELAISTIRSKLGFSHAHSAPCVIGWKQLLYQILLKYCVVLFLYASFEGLAANFSSSPCLTKKKQSCSMHNPAFCRVVEKAGSYSKYNEGRRQAERGRDRDRDRDSRERG